MVSAGAGAWHSGSSIRAIAGVDHAGAATRCELLEALKATRVHKGMPQSVLHPASHIASSAQLEPVVLV